MFCTIEHLFSTFELLQVGILEFGPLVALLTGGNLPMATNQLETAFYRGDELMSKSTKQAVMDSMLEVYKSVADSTDVLYCSAPITSGRRYIEWLERIGECFADLDGVDNSHREAHYNEVIEPNRTHAQQFIQKLRARSCCIVVDPTALPSLPGWSQPDWRSFWGKVIERYATEAFFINDWQYSNGCVYEFWVAHSKGIPVFSEDKQLLTLKVGISLIMEAVIKIQQHNQPTDFLEQTLDNINKLIY